MELLPIRLDVDYDDEKFSSKECRDVIEIYKTYYPNIGYLEPWIGYFIEVNGQIVGTCGFTGKPENGRIELAYWVFKDFEGEGAASDACQALINIALSNDPSVEITAKTEPEQNASARVLEKNGFYLAGEALDEEIGTSWLWIYMGE